MLGIRQKLSLGFGGLLAVIVVLGLLNVTLVTDLGNSVDVILRENYRSVIACQEMKEALERMDSGILFTLLGYEKEGSDLISKNATLFEKALEVELHNITLPGEGEKAEHILELFSQYRSGLGAARNPSLSHETRREAYFAQLLPLFQQIKAAADDILHMNQKNMSDANQQARQTAATARQQMIMLLTIGAAVAVGFMFFTRKWILRPVDRLIASAKEIEAGNLDLVVHANSRDEIGTLAEAFNAMAASLRELRRTDRAKLLRIQRSTEQAFKFLPDAIAIVDMEGNIEVASAAAADAFGLRATEKITEAPFQTVIDLFHEAVRTGRVSEPGNGRALIQRFIQDEERYFRPRAVPTLDADKQPTGVIIILSDATQERHQNELKKGVISTVAHQLRTPLTSVRMALHLLLEEKVGTLTEKQAELAIAAKEESDRLYAILEQLLNISRIESGKAQINLRVISSHQLVFESVEPFRRAAHDRGIALEVNLPEDLPAVIADSLLMGQVFANLLSNALKYTYPGGKVVLGGQATDHEVILSVSDTGRGIPRQYLQNILEQFFRVPGQGQDTGVGLGLSIVQEIVSAHGGAVNVESTEGEGSVFTFSLQRADALLKEEKTW
ncbi:MAG: HAMP domain-containing protein [Desulfomonile tiedjei]|uniref:histidine kinase n=1 Tax=Desulfomonile tiedjei TaxID=2358 RepID=A0A9D6UY45_9BACT|nr:HAMP domain-containing protein [Desulfomonile tiedjei]